MAHPDFRLYFAFCGQPGCRHLRLRWLGWLIVFYRVDSASYSKPVAADTLQLAPERTQHNQTPNFQVMPAGLRVTPS